MVLIGVFVFVVEVVMVVVVADITLRADGRISPIGAAADPYQQPRLG